MNMPGYRIVSEAQMVALIGELTMLRGLAGSVIEAFGFPGGPVQGISAEDLESMLTQHGLLRRVAPDACIAGPVTFACMQEAQDRGNRPTC